MATSGICKDGQHDECDGRVVMGAPGPFSLEKCKCKCHKKNRRDSRGRSRDGVHVEKAEVVMDNSTQMLRVAGL